MTPPSFPRAALLSFLRSIVGAQDAEDVYQDTVVRVLESPTRYEGRNGAAERTWLFEVAKNCAIDHLRREGRSPLSQAQPLDEDDAVVEGHERSAQRAQIAWHLERLTNEDRTVVEMYLVLGTLEATATALKIPKRTFQRRWNAILAQLKSGG